jgi:ElaB/YqjD/DUF883 family membrane-anchored ribosome-binding protein
MRQETEADILRRVEHTRERMGETIEEIGERVNPDRVQRELKARAREQVQELKNNAKQKARQTMRGMEHDLNEAGRGIWSTIRENPIPAGMVGVGLAWMFANRGGSSYQTLERAPYPEPGRGYAYGAPFTQGAPTQPYFQGTPATAYGQEEASVRERAQEIAEEVRDRADDALDSARDRVSQIADSASERWDHAQHAVTRGARRAEHRAEAMVRDNPLAAGVVAAALGFAVGYLIPETEREHQLMGPARDRALSRAKDTLLEARHVATDVARETVDEVLGGDRGREGESTTSPGR